MIDKPIVKTTNMEDKDVTLSIEELRALAVQKFLEAIFDKLG